MANVVWLKDVNSDDYGIIGEKASKIASFYQNGFTVPYSFVITIQAYQYFLENKGILNTIKRIINETNLDRESIVNTSETIQDMIMNIDVPDSIKEDTLYCYGHMNLDTDVLKMVNSKTLNFIKAGRDYPYLALRPSLNVKGIKARYLLNVKGKENFIQGIKSIYASIFNPDNIPIIKNYNLDELGIAILVQKMVNSDKYAVVNINPSQLSVNCVYGLGESFGITSPDSYVLDTNSLEVLNKNNNKQDAMFIRDDNYGRTIRKNLSNEISIREKLSNEELKRIANFSINVMNHVSRDSSIEIAIESGKYYLIDVNDYLIENSNEQLLNQQNSIQSTTSETPIVNDMFSMFSGQESITNPILSQSNNEYNIVQQNNNQKVNQNTKVPISFDIKVTDSTNIDELKAKLKAIKEFINQEF